MARRDRTYRGIFLKLADRTKVGLDFYATNLTLAKEHAAQVARDLYMHPEHGELLVYAVAPVDAATFLAGDAGSWFPVTEDGRGPCPHCARPTLPGYNTCGASDCQEAGYHANAARNGRVR